MSAEDWRLITEHYHGASDHALRMLFFPSRADYENNRLKPSLDRRWFDEWSLPRLKIPVPSLKNPTRRPSFLTALPDEAYVQVWKNVSENRELEFPSW